MLEGKDANNRATFFLVRKDKHGARYISPAAYKVANIQLDVVALGAI